MNAQTIWGLIASDLETEIAESKTIERLCADYYKNGADYKTLAALADEIGAIMSKVAKKNVNINTLENAEITRALIDDTIGRLLEEGHNYIADGCVKVQAALNATAGINIKAQTPELDVSRVDNLCNKIVETCAIEGNTIESAEHLLAADIMQNFERSIVDKAAKDNASIQSRAGYRPRIRRTLAGGCCDWCAAIGGEWFYGDEPSGVYRRHRFCGCLVEYIAPKGQKTYRENIWSKEALTVDIGEQHAAKYTKKQSTAGLYESAQKQFNREKKERLNQLFLQLANAKTSQERARIANAIKIGKSTKFNG